LDNLATLSAARGDGAQAVEFQARANAIDEHSISLNLNTGSERQKLSYLRSLLDKVDKTISLQLRLAPDDRRAREQSVALILQRKGRVQDVMTNSLSSLRRHLSAEDQELLGRLNATYAQLSRLVLEGSQQIPAAEQRIRIGTLEEQKEKLEAEISRRSAGFYQQSHSVTFDAIHSAVPDNAALIEFAIYRPFDPKAIEAKAFGEPRCVAYVLRKQGEVQWRELGEAKVLAVAIDQLREALRDPKRQDVRQLARALDEKLMKPVRPLLGDATQLLVSPDGALNLIPYEALVDEQNRYLIERFSFAYLASGRDLLRLQVARDSKSNPIVVANPAFGEPELTAMANAGGRGSQLASLGAKRQTVTTGSDFAPLGGTTGEAQAIKSLFAEASVLTGTRATESSLKRVSAPRIMHIATHGFFLTDAPVPSNAIAEKTRAISASIKIANPLLRSGLALAGANLRQSGTDDGILTALEASALNLWGTKLVTLSACDTGVGEVKNGEGVYGLRRAFVLAGTETLVMSMWPVSDYVTRELMTAYYRGLKQGQGRGEALRQVQLSMLKRKGRDHPFYWASFIQSGEWANLDGKR
jgi:CHAT domain-containing protein